MTDCGLNLCLCKKKKKNHFRIHDVQLGIFLLVKKLFLIADIPPRTLNVCYHKVPVHYK